MFVYTINRVLHLIPVLFILSVVVFSFVHLLPGDIVDTLVGDEDAEDPEIRERLSEQSGWPTIPHLFVKGKLIGGADITMELHQRGELLDILDISEN